jgi:hypothetical protein
MGRRLVGTVLVHVDGAPRFYGPDDDIPADVVKQIGDHAWVDDGDDEGGGQSAAPVQPPLGGPGSGVEAWALYAGELGVNVDGLTKREEIVDAIKAAGHTVEQPAS